MKFSSTNSWSASMKLALPFVVALIASFWTPATVTAQATCTYTIQMFDSFGDGWNGGMLTITSNGVVTTHTLTTGTTGSSTFQVTHGTPVIVVYTAGAFATEVGYDILNPDGMLVFSGGPAGAPAPLTGEVFNGTGACPSCPAPNMNTVIINQITDSTARVNWLDVNVADSYLVEYGPAGFPLGFGLVVDTVSSITDLKGLNPCVTYDVYIAAVCGVDSVSNYTGPFTFTTTYTPSAPGGTCTYTLQFFDSFGDGWNGGTLTLNHNGVNTTFGMVSGLSVTHTFTATSNLPIKFTFTAGAFLNEVSYKILDPNGVVIFQDGNPPGGPGPQTGLVFTTIACPTCPGPLNAWMSDVNATNAKLAWQPSIGATGSYIVEYGPLGFTLGTGTVVTVPNSKSLATLNGLLEDKYYDVYVKLDCGTEFSKAEGPVSFHTLWKNDVGVASLTMPDFDTQCNFGQNEKLTIGLHNYGQAPQTLFKFFFAVNGIPASIPVPQDGLFTGVVGNDSTQLIAFETTWDFSVPGLYIIEVWTELEGDSNPANDTFRLEVLTAYPKPLKEDFEDNMVPATWTHDGIIYAPNAHNNPTFVVADNLYSGDKEFILTTQRIGPLETGDSLTFDYRYVNWSAGTVATVIATNKLAVQISIDCGDTFTTVFTIDSSNHVASNMMAKKKVNLSQYAGKAVTVRFLATWGIGDYWLDLDNINILGCPGSLVLLAKVKPAFNGEPNGTIDVNPYFGQAPFTYSWSTGDTTKIIGNLPPGVYEVTVTDANGCSDVSAYNINILVGIEDEVEIAPEIRMYPNPTRGTAFLDVNFAKATDFQVRLLNTSGQVLYQVERWNESSAKQELDLSQQPPGMYIVQIVADGKPYHAKLMVVR